MRIAGAGGQRGVWVIEHLAEPCTTFFKAATDNISGDSGADVLGAQLGRQAALWASAGPFLLIDEGVARIAAMRE